MEKVKIPKRVWDDKKWMLSHMDKLQKKYKEKWVAVVNKKVVGVGENGEIARKMARKKTGAKQIPVILVESGQSLY